MDHLIQLFFGNPRRLFGAIAGMLVVLMIAAPKAFHWLVGRILGGIVPYVQLIIWGAVVWFALRWMVTGKKGG